MISCYNRGCGKDFDPANNGDDACRHHPGVPFFHDAYKGWTCCNKKSVDFTEFLNIKGCEVSKHSNVKPPEPEKPTPKEVVEDIPVAEIREPLKPSALVRPAVETPLINLVPTIAPALKQSIDSLIPAEVKKTTNVNSEIAIGTVCKNGGCGIAYESPSTNDTSCIHHPGTPIFHEGLKYWSCCAKKTTDFTAFMSQRGCKTGDHKWISNNEASKSIQCRYDWHQTGSNVVVAIYAKLYHYEQSFIKVNPVRLVVGLVFPQQDNAEFNLDVELCGIVDISKATAHMYGTKVELTLPKAEPGTWATLDIKQKPSNPVPNFNPKINEDEISDEEDSDVDLDDIEPIRGAKITETK